MDSPVMTKSVRPSFGRAQVAWETPRNILLVTVTAAVLVSGTAFLIGFKLGQATPAPPTVNIYLHGASAAPMPGSTLSAPG